MPRWKVFFFCILWRLLKRDICQLMTMFSTPLLATYYRLDGRRATELCKRDSASAHALGNVAPKTERKAARERERERIMQDRLVRCIRIYIEFQRPAKDVQTLYLYTSGMLLSSKTHFGVEQFAKTLLRRKFAFWLVYTLRHLRGWSCRWISTCQRND